MKTCNYFQTRTFHKRKGKENRNKGEDTIHNSVDTRTINCPFESRNPLRVFGTRPSVVINSFNRKLYDSKSY